MADNDEQSVTYDEVKRVENLLKPLQANLPPNSMALVWVTTDSGENYTLNFCKSFTDQYPEAQFQVLMRMAAVVMEVGSLPVEKLLTMYKAMSMQALAVAKPEGGVH